MLARKQRTEGTPQGDPLSPLLSNILLNDLDQELERGQLAFCPCAYDCNVYIGSRVARDLMMLRVRTFLEDALKLRINAEKSAVARPWERKFLGYTVTMQRGLRCQLWRRWLCPTQCRQRSRSVVERRSIPHEPGPASPQPDGAPARPSIWT